MSAKDAQGTEKEAITLIEAAIRLLSETDELTMRYVIVVDVLCTDDDRRLRVLPSEGSADWDIVGLLTYALTMIDQRTA